LSAVLGFDFDAVLDLGAVLSFNDMTSSYIRIEGFLPRYFGLFSPSPAQEVYKLNKQPICRLFVLPYFSPGTRYPLGCFVL
jgi:hypothetical protein